jgi:hypothetical protein
MSKVRRDPIARRHCSRGFPLTSFTFSCRDGSHACFTYNQRLERSEAIERLERFERPQIFHLLPRAYSITYCFLPTSPKTGFRICPINDDLLPVEP